MAYKIEAKDGYVEVQVTGRTTKHEIIEILRELSRRDPRKETPDLWLVESESQVPLADFIEIALAVGKLLPPGIVGARSALVAADHFQMAEMQMYRLESSFLPFELGVFHTQAEALAWLRDPEPTRAAK